MSIIHNAELMITISHLNNFSISLTSDQTEFGQINLLCTYMLSMGKSVNVYNWKTNSEQFFNPCHED